MILRDLHSTLNYQRAISPVTLANVNTAQVGQWIDLADAMALEFVILTGALTDADATFVVLVEESDDQSVINAVADADLLPAPNNITAVVPELQAGFTFAADDSIRSIGYVGIKRYARITITPATNDAGSASFGCVAVTTPRIRGTATGI